MLHKQKINKNNLLLQYNCQHLLYEDQSFNQDLQSNHCQLGHQDSQLNHEECQLNDQENQSNDLERSPSFVVQIQKQTDFIRQFQDITQSSKEYLNSEPSLWQSSYAIYTQPNNQNEPNLSKEFIPSLKSYHQQSLPSISSNYQTPINIEHSQITTYINKLQTQLYQYQQELLRMKAINQAIIDAIKRVFSVKVGQQLQKYMIKQNKLQIDNQIQTKYLDFTQRFNSKQLSQQFQYILTLNSQSNNQSSQKLDKQFLLNNQYHLDQTQNKHQAIKSSRKKKKSQSNEIQTLNKKDFKKKKINIYQSNKQSNKQNKQNKSNKQNKQNKSKKQNKQNKQNKKISQLSYKKISQQQKNKRQNVNESSYVSYILTPSKRQSLNSSKVDNHRDGSYSQLSQCYYNQNQSHRSKNAKLQNRSIFKEYQFEQNISTSRSNSNSNNINRQRKIIATEILCDICHLNFTPNQFMRHITTHQQQHSKLHKNNNMPNQINTQKLHYLDHKNMLQKLFQMRRQIQQQIKLLNVSKQQIDRKQLKRKLEKDLQNIYIVIKQKSRELKTKGHNIKTYQ